MWGCPGPPFFFFLVTLRSTVTDLLICCWIFNQLNSLGALFPQCRGEISVRDKVSSYREKILHVNLLPIRGPPDDIGLLPRSHIYNTFIDIKLTYHKIHLLKHAIQGLFATADTGSGNISVPSAEGMEGL